MRDISTLRIDLGIEARKIASQIMIDNKSIEEQIALGIEKAMDEMTSEEGFVEYVKEGTKKAVEEAIKSATNSWEFQNKVKESLSKKLDEKIRHYTDGVAEKLLKDL